VPHDVLDGERATERELLAFARTKLAEHKVPVRIAVIPEIPKTPAGKLDKRALREASYAAS
jgi:acyl-CoA synthetase (AMP-forming)/AMP-acid ligase II